MRVMLWSSPPSFSSRRTCPDWRSVTLTTSQPKAPRKETSRATAIGWRVRSPESRWGQRSARICANSGLAPACCSSLARHGHVGPPCPFPLLSCMAQWRPFCQPPQSTVDPPTFPDVKLSRYPAHFAASCPDAWSIGVQNADDTSAKFCSIAPPPE